MMHITDIPARVRFAIQENGESHASLARKAGLHRNTLYGCEREGWNPSLDTLRKLAPHLPPLKSERKDAAA